MTAPPRIRVLGAAFAAVPGPGPQSMAMLSMLEALRAELDLVTLKTEDLSHIKQMGEARMFRVPVGTAPLVRRRELYARAVARQLDAEAYDVVHVLDPWAGAEARERKRRSKLLYEIATFPADDPAEEKAWCDAHEATLAIADCVLVPTQAAAQVLRARGARARIEIVHPGVDAGRFDQVELPQFDAPRLLCLGPLSCARDVEGLIDAVRRITALRPVRVLIAGQRDPATREAWRRAIVDAGLRASIEVRGEPGPDALASIISGTDICVVPAIHREIAGLTELPQPLLEYLACYRPVVAAAIPGLSEVVRDDVEALLYPPGDGAALADAVLELLRDASLRDRLVEAGRARVRDDLSSAARRRRLRELYDALVPGSQYADPWEERFEEQTGTIAMPLEEASVDTAETTLPETEKPSLSRPPVREESARSSVDTHPGFVVPDTDPGRR